MINRKFGIEIEFVNADRNILISNLRTANIMQQENIGK